MGATVGQIVKRQAKKLGEREGGSRLSWREIGRRGELHWSTVKKFGNDEFRPNPRAEAVLPSLAQALPTDDCPSEQLLDELRAAYAEAERQGEGRDEG